MSWIPHDVVKIIGGIPIPVILVDRNLWILAANDEAEKFYNAKLQGTSLVLYLRHPEAMTCIQKALNESTEVVSLISEIRNEFEISLNLKVKPLLFEGLDQTALMISFHDVTYIDEADEMRRDFVANVSHELRSPLTALSGFIETLGSESWDNPKVRKKFLKIMADEANRMGRLVTNLLSLSKVEASERLNPTNEVNLLEIIDISQNSLRHLKQKRKIDINRASEFPDLIMYGDKDQLVQVFHNLFENAVKYSPKGSTVNISYQLTCSEDEQKSVRIDIRDQGRGFDPIHIPRLTERFYRVDKHRSREISGTGLGLAIVKHILNRHRGQLLINSELGKGSVFTVILPLIVTEMEIS